MPKSPKPAANKKAAKGAAKVVPNGKTGQNSKVLNSFFALLATEPSIFKTTLFCNAAGVETEHNFVRDTLGDRIPNFVESSTPPEGQHLEWHQYWSEIHDHMKTQAGIPNHKDGATVLNGYRTPEGAGVAMLYEKGEKWCTLVTDKVSCNSAPCDYQILKEYIDEGSHAPDGCRCPIRLSQYVRDRTSR